MTIQVFFVHVRALFFPSLYKTESIRTCGKNLFWEKFINLNKLGFKCCGSKCSQFSILRFLNKGFTEIHFKTMKHIVSTDHSA